MEKRKNSVTKRGGKNPDFYVFYGRSLFKFFQIDFEQNFFIRYQMIKQDETQNPNKTYNLMKIFLFSIVQVSLRIN